MGPTPKHNDRKPNAGERIDRELSACASNLWGALSADSESAVYAVYLRNSTGRLWVAVAKRYGPAPTLSEVAFGQGLSVGAALSNLNASVAKGQWKPDKPWRGRE